MLGQKGRERGKLPGDVIPEGSTGKGTLELSGKMDSPGAQRAPPTEVRRGSAHTGSRL